MPNLAENISPACEPSSLARMSSPNLLCAKMHGGPVSALLWCDHQQGKWNTKMFATFVTTVSAAFYDAALVATAFVEQVQYTLAV